MSSPAEKLAESLQALYDLRSFTNSNAVQSSELSRTHRERLLQAGFLERVVRGWYLISDPKKSPGETTSWYISYWGFCARFLREKYGKKYYVSADQSLLLHAGFSVVPEQLLVHAPSAPNRTTELIHGASLYVVKSKMPTEDLVVTVNGLNLLSPTGSLIQSSPTLFSQQPAECKAVLGMFKDVTPLLRILLAGGHSHIAGRLAGGLRHIGYKTQADKIVGTMAKAFYKIREVNPFQPELPNAIFPSAALPEVCRLRLEWARMREIVVADFPAAPGLPEDQSAYLSFVDALYSTDAYHSLSIENYRVSPQLIERVKAGNWNPGRTADEEQKNALAARGYWNASQVVKKSIERVLRGENAGSVVAEDLTEWYQELFGPTVQVGILRPEDLAGYRSNQVYITNSRHIPPHHRLVFPLMEAYFDLLTQESEASVRVVLGHFFLGYLHPFMDGNGRIARFLMNVMLASGGYPWTIIKVEDREQYMQSLEKASSEGDIEAFTRFLKKQVESA